jgi:hypothetical protein
LVVSSLPVKRNPLRSLRGMATATATATATAMGETAMAMGETAMAMAETVMATHRQSRWLRESEAPLATPPPIAKTDFPALLEGTAR